jgi:DNA repair exonuclease SbcCD ATPase subunit
MLTHIFHVSDIHIRNGDIKQCRYDEYLNVFLNLFESLKNNILRLKLKKDNFVIIVSGDIFHNKNNIGNYGLVLYKKFIEGLTKIGKTILFHGNHDKNQNEVDQPSLISSTMDIKNLILLEKTGCFSIEDICFSYVSVDDTLDNLRTNGRLDVLPTFPEEDAVYKVAMFHGTFGNVKLYNGMSVTDEHKPYPFKWISNFDFAILGDIHLRQHGTYGKTLWGYSGSLIQQNYGEDIINHGYMIWDIRNKKIEEINVANNIGMVNIKEEDNRILIRNRGKYENIENYINNDFFPQHLEIKVYSPINISLLIDILNKQKITFNITSHIVHKNRENIEFSRGICDIQVNKETLLEYFHKHLTEEQHIILADIVKNYDTLYFDISKYPDELQEDILKKNKEISGFISNCIQNDVKQNSPSFVIQNAKWNNIYCYKGENEINFNNAINNTFLISGTNGTGKSAIYDIITMGIWGDVTSSRSGSMTQSIINFSCNNGYIEICIKCEDKEYVIKRYYKRGQNVILKKVDVLCDGNIFKKDNAANEFIKAKFGNLDEFLTSSMITQYNDNDILKMNYKECISIIDNAIELDYIYNLYTLLKCCLNKYKDLHKTLISKKNVYEKILTREEQQDDIVEIEQQLGIYLKKKEEMVTKYYNIHIPNDCEMSIVSVSNLQTKLSQYPDVISKEKYEKTKLSIEKLYYDLSNYTDDNIRENAEKFEDGMIIVENIEKPCNLDFIREEEKALANCKFEECEVVESIEEIKERMDKIGNEINRLNDIKPIYCEMSNYNDDEIQNLLIEYYDTKETEILFQYFENDKSNARIEKNLIYIKDYRRSITLKEKAEKKRENLLKKQGIEEQNLEALYDKFNHMYSYNRGKPSSYCKFKSYNSLIRNIEKINIEKIREDIPIIENKIKDYDILMKQKEETKTKYCDLRRELNHLETDKQYEYDKNCKFCCNRPWVKRIVEINNTLQTIQEEIAGLEEKAFNYEIKKKEFDYLKEREREYEVLTEWKEYYYFTNEVDKIQNSITKCKNTIIKYKNLIDQIDLDIDTNKRVIDEFIRQSSIIYKCVQDNKKSIIYENWRKEYCRNQCLKSEVENVYEKYYEKTILKPRYDKLIDLNRKYQEWQEKEDINLCVKAHEYMIMKEELNLYEGKQRLLESIQIQLKIEEKNMMKEQIDLLERDICLYRDRVAKARTIQEYQDQNNNEYTIYNDLCMKVLDTKTVIETIIEKFKTYRVDLYNNYILKGLVAEANRFIKTTCHDNTKAFELEYNITDVKDNIHINWMIKTKDGVNSTNQASGFQRFVISLALRMSLFTKRRCQQIFFDEGFTACDKNNLSIVPAFLKGLLKIFESVIVVSHIDIIQDSMDIISRIEYDKKRGSYIKC